MTPIAKLFAMVLFMTILTMGLFPEIGTASEIEFHPIKHATLVIQWDSTTIYVDPVEDPKAFASYPKPDLILITDIHKDHLNKGVVDALKQPETLIVGPKEVIKQLMEGKIITNGETLTWKGLTIEAIPAYNLTEDRQKFHPKGRGNGYVVGMVGKRVYISGDTEDIPEMRQLENIDYALICMNLPYTMTEEQAVSAVLEFKPKVVIPYHYRGKDGLSDVAKFKRMVKKEGHTQVNLLPWY